MTAIEAGKLTRGDLGKRVSVKGVYATFQSAGKVTVLGELVSISHNSHGVTVRFKIGRDLRLEPDSLVIYVDEPMLFGKPYVSPPVVVGGKVVS